MANSTVTNSTLLNSTLTNSTATDGGISRGPFNLARGSQYIVIVASTAIIWTIFVFLVRAFLREKVNGPFGWDDAACAAATFFGITFSGLTLVDVHYGLGENINDLKNFQENTFFLLLYVQNMLYFLAASFAQVSVAALIGRIGKVRAHLIMAYGLAAMSGICAIICTFLVAFACDFPRPWMNDNRFICTIDRWHIWLGNGIISGLIEFCLVKTAVLLV